MEGFQEDKKRERGTGGGTGGEELLFCQREVCADFRSSMFLCPLCMH